MKLEKLYKIEGLFFLIESSISNGQGVALSTIDDLKEASKSIVELTDYSIVNKNQVLANRIISLKVGVLYMITPNVINRLDDNNMFGQSSFNYIGRNTFSPEYVKRIIDEAKEAFNWAINTIQKYDFYDSEPISLIDIPKNEQTVISPQKPEPKEFEVKDKCLLLDKIHSFCISDSCILKKDVNIETFLSCIRNADFSPLYYKKRPDIKVNKKADFKYLIYSLKNLMGDEWYGLSVKSIGHSKSECSGANTTLISEIQNIVEDD